MKMLPRSAVCSLRSLLLAVAGVLALNVSSALAAGDLAAAAADGSLWEQSRSDLLKNALSGYVFRKVDATTHRIRKVANKIKFGTMETGDVIIHWEDDTTARIIGLDTTIFNKGDDGELSKQDFEAKLKASIASMDELMGVQGAPCKVGKKDAGVKVRAWEWSSENCYALLEASSSGVGKKYVAEFIRLTMGADRESVERGGADDAAKRSDLKEHVRTESDGSVWIEGIPMVDQGEKGYCVPATVSRVFAYYGMDGVDQHALAALCKSSGDGTTLEAMGKALSSISGSFHMSVTSFEWMSMKTLSKEYEKKAQKMNVNPYSLSPSVLLRVVNDKPALVKKGLKSIRRYVDAGIPIVWGVMLGIFPEQGLPQSMGGHMRLIIGYNEQKQTIIYSDTWGAAHAKKEMPMSQACAMTRIMYVLRPMR